MARLMQVGDSGFARRLPLPTLNHGMTHSLIAVDIARCARQRRYQYLKKLTADGSADSPWVIEHKTAIFRQINKDKIAAHHDALEFPDGRMVLLTTLCQGQRATVSAGSLLQ
jgi:hypothetical protein